MSFTEGPAFSADPAGAAARAIAAVAAASGPVVVHFDVDVVDSGDLPLGNFPHYGSGVTAGSGHRRAARAAAGTRPSRAWS